MLLVAYFPINSHCKASFGLFRAYLLRSRQNTRRCTVVLSPRVSSAALRVNPNQAEVTSCNEIFSSQVLCDWNSNLKHFSVLQSTKILFLLVIDDPHKRSHHLTKRICYFVVKEPEKTCHHSSQRIAKKR